MTFPSCHCHSRKIIILIIGYLALRIVSQLLLRTSFPLVNLISSLERLLSLGIIVMLSVGSGHFILRKANLFTSCSIFDFCLSFTLGLVTLSYVSFLALVRIGGLNLFLPLVALPLYLAIREWSLFFPDMIPRSPERFSRFRALEILFVAILGLLLVYPLYTALSPPFSWDAQVYHLLIPKTYLDHGGFVSIPHNIYSNMPLNIQMLYLTAMVTGDDVTAKLLHFAMGVFVCLSMYALSRRHLSLRAGLAAPLLFLCHPMVYYEFGVAFIDVGLALFFLMMGAAFLEYLKTGRPGYVVVMGIMAGMGMGSKYTMIAGAAAGFILLLVEPLSGGRWGESPGRTSTRFFSSGRLHILALFSGPAFLLLLPWFLKNDLLVHNPIYPMMSFLFQGKEWTAQQSSWLVDWQHNIGMGRSAIDYLLLPFRLFFRSDIERGYGGFAGTLYPYILILFPAILAAWKKRREIRVLFLLFFLFFVFWSLGAQQVRFLIPALPFLALCSAEGVISLVSSSRYKWLGVVGIIIILIAPVHLVWRHILPEIRREGSYFPAIAGEETRGEFLRHRLRPYPCFEYIGNNTGPGQKVLFLFENRGYHCPRPFIADGMFEASHFLSSALEAGSPEAFRDRLSGYSFRYIIIDERIREDVMNLDKNLLFSKRENAEKYRKALDIVDRFIQGFLLKEFEENQATVYRMKKQPI